MPVRCEEVQELLPQYAEWGPRPAGEVEAHLATCPRCGPELEAYRRMMRSLSDYREREVDPPPGYLERTLALVPQGTAGLAPGAEWRRLQGRVVAAVKQRPAAASISGALLGAAAIGIVMWRRGRRALQVPELAPQ